MDVSITFGEGQDLTASFGKFGIHADASVKNGGMASNPEPVDYFFSSLALCAAYYLRKFIEERKLDSTNLGLTLSVTKVEEGSYQRKFHYQVNLPNNFPEKYKNTVQKVLEGCTVKKMIESNPQFEVTLI